MRKEVFRQACVVGAAVVVFFTLLGRPYLWDEDEPKNAECAREMLEAGNWVVPQFNYALRTDKPILLYWLMLTSYKVFGVNEFAARFWSAALGVGTVWLTYGIGRRLYGAQAGLWSGLALATCVLIGVAARGATPDATLAFCTTASLYLFIRCGGLRDGRLTQGGAAAAALAMGLAVLAKGPVGVLLPVGAFGLFLLCRLQQQASGATCGPWHRRWIAHIGQTLAPRRWQAATMGLRPVTLLLVVCAAALPWYVLVGLRTDGAWLAGFLGKHNVARFTGAMEGHDGSILYHPAVIMVGFFPWSCFLPIGVYKLVLRLRDPAAAEFRAADTLLACWAGLYISFFSLSATKLPGYVLPCYPALAVITGKLIADFVNRPDAVPRLWFRWALYTPAIAGAALGVGLPIAAAIFLPGEQWLGVVGASLVVGSAALVIAANRLQPVAVPIVFAGMSLVFVASLVAVAASRVSLHANSPAIAREAREHAGADAALVGFRHFEPTLPFYFGGRVPTAHGVEQLQALLHENPHACIVTRDEFLGDLESALGAKPEIAARQRRFLRRSGDVVLVLPPKPPAAVAQSEPTLLR